MRAANYSILADDCTSQVCKVVLATYDTWLLKNNITKTQECRCWDIKARCYATRKPLFGKKCTKITTERDTVCITGVVKTFYFVPKHYTLWCCRQ